jgi:hypothetical protein
MAAAAFKVEGLDTFLKTLRRAGADMNDLKDANSAAAQTIASAASARAPRRSGALAGSVRGSRQARRVVVRAGGARVPYAGVIHYGWPRHNISPQPFLVDAAVDSQPQWLPKYSSDLQQILDKVRGT